MPTIKDVENSLNNCQATLQKYFDDVNTDPSPDDEILKLRNEYFKWTDMKTKFIDSEKNFHLPYNALPSKISKYSYNYLYQDKKDIVDKYYKKDDKTGEFIINANKKNIPINEAETLIHNLVLKRGNVVWVNFGYNIGVEFGGRHPAIILRNNKESLFVAPLSSQTPKDMDINVFIDYVYGCEKMDRYVNVLRLCHVSIIRVDLLSKTGSVKGTILDEIINKAKIKI